MANATLQELRDELTTQIRQSALSGIWTDDFKDTQINRAGQRVLNWYLWKTREKALSTTTHDEQEYYDNPDGETNAFKKNSIYNILIEGEDYGTKPGRERVDWAEFLKEKNSESERKVFSNHDGLIFLYPVPEDGKEMTLFGLKEWVWLVENADVSVLEEEFDEAIIRLALAACMRKVKEYDSATAELNDVLSPKGGILAGIRDQQESQSAQGYIGKARNSRQ